MPCDSYHFPATNHITTHRASTIRDEQMMSLACVHEVHEFSSNLQPNPFPSDYQQTCNEIATYRLGVPTINNRKCMSLIGWVRIDSTSKNYRPWWPALQNRPSRAVTSQTQSMGSPNALCLLRAHVHTILHSHLNIACIPQDSQRTDAHKNAM